MDSFRINFEQNNEKTTVLVRSKNGNKPISDNYHVAANIPIEMTLSILKLERVPINELVSAYKQIKTDDILIGQICGICQEEYKLRQYKRELECKHVFHKKCIDKWFKNSITCPVCRAELELN